MNKKGVEVSPPPLIVVIILVLMVLLVLLFIFGDQTRDFLQRIGIIKGGLSEDKCESLIFGRTCNCDSTSDTYYCTEEPPPAGIDQWSDCNPCYKAVPRD